MVPAGHGRFLPEDHLEAGKRAPVLVQTSTADGGGGAAAAFL